MIMMVGLLESPSDCNVSEKKFGRIKNIESIHKGVKYIKVSSMHLSNFENIKISPKNGVQMSIINQITKQITIP